MTSRKSEYDVKGLKAALLKSTPTATECQLLGSRVYLRRLTAAELLQHEAEIKKAIEEDDISTASRLNVQLVIECIVAPTGERIPHKQLPTVDELLAAHDNRTLLDAIEIVRRHAIGLVEDAEKN